MSLESNWERVGSHPDDNMEIVARVCEDGEALIAPAFRGCSPDAGDVVLLTDADRRRLIVILGGDS